MRTHSLHSLGAERGDQSQMGLKFKAITCGAVLDPSYQITMVYNYSIYLLQVEAKYAQIRTEGKRYQDPKRQHTIVGKNTYFSDFLGSGYFVSV